jgi:hypothetical protein
MVEKKYGAIRNDYQMRLRFLINSEAHLKILLQFASKDLKSFFEACREAYTAYLSLLNRIETAPEGFKALEHYVNHAETAPEEAPEELHVPELMPCLTEEFRTYLKDLSNSNIM